MSVAKQRSLMWVCRKVFFFSRFILVVIRELMQSSWAVTRSVLALPRLSICPAWIEYDATDLTVAERLVLAHCISLTPGTVAVDVERADGRLLLHVLEAPSPPLVVSAIKQRLQKPLLEWTRC